MPAIRCVPPTPTDSSLHWGGRSQINERPFVCSLRSKWRSGNRPRSSGRGEGARSPRASTPGHPRQGPARSRRRAHTGRRREPSETVGPLRQAHVHPVPAWPILVRVLDGERSAQDQIRGQTTRGNIQSRVSSWPGNLGVGRALSEVWSPRRNRDRTPAARRQRGALLFVPQV